MKKKTFSNENVYTWKQTCGSDHYLIIACKNKIYSRYLSEKEQLSNSILTLVSEHKVLVIMDYKSYYDIDLQPQTDLWLSCYLLILSEPLWEFDGVGSVTTDRTTTYLAAAPDHQVLCTIYDAPVHAREKGLYDRRRAHLISNPCRNQKH